MQIRDLFEKNIEREIRSVVKVLDDQYIADEISEFVLTDEMLGNISGIKNGGMIPGLIEQLSNNKDFNKSVWVSGFYGSGKSHLLKMLSYALSGRQINGSKASDLFAEIFKTAGDFELEANYKRLLNTKIETILFDIATVQFTNTDNNPVLTAFTKEFNRHAGYSYQPNIAAIERDIEKQGLLSQFKEAFLQKTGLDWKEERDVIGAFDTNLVSVYTQVANVSEDAARAYIDERRQDYKIDTDGFVKLVADYLVTRGDDTTLIFCADEVSQFIDNSSKLLSFQMIAEGLSTITTGRALIFATAQTDINTLVGQYKAEQQYDFTKLSARFEYKIPLTSASVDQVVKQRLLKKKPGVYQELGGLYDKEQHNLKTLFDFSDDTQKYPKYRDAEDFIDTYPAVPYQFDLLMSVIKGLSDHSVFSGSHESVGERSMLKRFHDALKAKADSQTPEVIEFSQFFDSLRPYFQPKVLTEIIQAERQYADNPLAIKVLKTLLLIKYVKSFKPTLENVAILLVPTLDPDFQIDAFKKDIKAVLEELELKTFIRKNGSHYEYLTDLEKDVDNEIKNTLIENTDRMDVLKEFLFNDILPDSSVRLLNGKIAYEFGKKINDTPIAASQSKEFNVNVVVPMDSTAYSESQVATSSMGVDDLVVSVPTNSRLVSELQRYCQTKKYLKLAQRDGSDPEKSTTIQAHEALNYQRRSDLIQELRQAIVDAPMYINGSQQQIANSNDAKTKVLAGLQHLAEITYPRMSELQPATQEDIRATITQSDNVLLDRGLSTPEQEILSRITLEKTLSNRLTIEDTIRHFKAKPYGWDIWAVANCIASLFKTGKIKLTRESTELGQADLFDALTNNRQRPNVLISPEQEYTAEQIKFVKDAARDNFNKSIEESEAKKVVEDFKKIVQNELTEIKGLYAQRSQFPFLENLSQTINILEAVKDQPNEYYFTELEPAMNELRQSKDDILQIKSFFNGGQKDKYVEAKSFYDANKVNFSYFNDRRAIETLRGLLGDSKPYAGGTIPAIYNAYNELKQQLEKILEERKQQANQEAHAKLSELTSNTLFEQLDENSKNQVSAELSGLVSSISEADNMPLVEQKRQNIGTVYTECLNRLTSLTATAEAPAKSYVQAASLRPNFRKTTLDSEQDVNEYVDQMRQDYLDALRDNKGITL